MNLTRIAPTPSGFLHIGNLVNFKLVDWLAKEIDCPIALRIDDVDAARVRPQYVEDIFEKLLQLDIEILVGPANSVELEDHSQTRKIQAYWSLLQEMRQKTSSIFVCVCSRTQRLAGRCVSGCKEKNYEYLANVNAIRIEVGDRDEVLWRRDNLPAYHLTDIFDDSTLGVTHVVRGVDLFESTLLQTELRGLLGLPIPTYLFHPLLIRTGEKLSKSTGTDFLTIDQYVMHQIESISQRFIPLLSDQIASPTQSGADLFPVEID